LALRRRLAAEDLGERLQKRRAQLGLTQEQVAERLDGVTLRAYQRWESGEAVPQDRNLHKAASALDLDPAELVVELVPLGGMGDNQLDRIEAKLDQLLSLTAQQQVAGVSRQVREKAKTPPTRRRKPA
jgi:transcriptional regulator with XRE-family HTH domain